MKRIVSALAVFAFIAALASCENGVQLVGPAAEDCSARPYFSVLPVALADIDKITVHGGLSAPGHTLPTPHAGLYLATEGAVVRAPGPLQITGLRRTTYVASPTRQGKTDFVADFQVCKQVSGWFGHLTTLSEAIPVTGGWNDCKRYNTSTETVETCTATLDGVSLSAGQTLGTGGLSKALGLMGLDFGLTDSRVNNGFVAEWRFPEPHRRAICAWDRFESSVQSQLYTKLSDPSRFGSVALGEPRCGTMKVDVAGTAKGIWALSSVKSPLGGSEVDYITLANYPYRPETQLALSLGPSSLGADVAVVARGTGSGRVNRPFEQVTNDGLIYCYGPDSTRPVTSWLIMMTGPNALSIRRVEDRVSNPCNSAPATWSMTGALTLVR
jgi:hypothetical protein